MCSESKALSAQWSAGSVERRPVLEQRRQEEKEGQVKTGVLGKMQITYIIHQFIFALFYLYVSLLRRNVDLI